MKKDQIRNPVKNKVAKVPVVMQMEDLECGAACLTMILAYYRKWIPLEQVRLDCGVSRDGSNAKNVLFAARQYGLDAKGFRLEPELLREKGTFPCIIHWNFNHFVVLDGFRGKYAILNDPARGQVRVSMEEFNTSFTGVCLMFVPTEKFEPGGKPKSVLEFAKKRLKGAAPVIVFVVLTQIIANLFGIVNPMMSRIFIDRLLTGVNPEWLMPFLLIMVALSSLEIITAWIKTIYSLRLNGKMSVIGSTTYLWKVLRLPMVFFSQRSAGDIQMRQDANASIAETLVNTVAPLALNTVMMIFYLTVMLKNSVLLTMVGLSTILINALISRLISAKRVNMTRVQMRDSGKLASTTLAGISLIETLKASGAEDGFFRKWAGYQAAVNSQSVAMKRMTNVWGIIPGIISTLANQAVLVIGVWLTMQGRFTVGMIFLFQGYLSAFMSPANSLITAGQSIQEMRTNMERVEDVMQYPVDDAHRQTNPDSDEDYAKLSGNVTLDHVTFGYSRLAPPLIKDFSMELKIGSRVAFVGASGCGKSTLSKLISGLYQPWSGRILFDGQPASEIDHDVFTGSVAVVDQEITLFEDTIANNIKMWDQSIEDFEMILAARDAQIHTDIMQRPGGYQGKLTEGGRDLSGGQRQRLEIARVLAQDPTIIILDEATSALDAKTEYEVVKSIRDRGITCIVIAHRLSTIRDCDEIIVLDHGNVVERGTHEELMQLGGAYAELIAND
ncbi:MAG: NHLP family bacteriocin export ABC transporter peptidase/permease/ATPase subunit [Blautia sp.]|nr:NHLP family bacteriocin export ABC transporter peptidase/permease/ATPase subunit [Blautia sp.]